MDIDTLSEMLENAKEIELENVDVLVDRLELGG
jgi:hypothetical protein